MGNEIKDTNYYQISGWMINKLNLKGTPLNVFAIIYGFCQDEQSEFTGSRSYIANFLNTTRPTIDKALNELCSLGYVIKSQKIINGVIFNTYKVNLDLVKKLYIGSKETLQGGCKEILQGSKETLHNNNNYNNNINNNNYNNINNKEKKENKKEKKYNQTAIDKIIEEQNFSSELNNSIYEFIKMRKAIKKPMTDRAVVMLLNKLNKLANNEKTKIDIINQSIYYNWQDIYSLKEENTEEIKKEEFGICL